ncbi:MAG: RNA polymerase sigma-70 factor [Lewinella sp.]|nr:RNA polymerase sigma-70 factor [Lewinella sp.]
MENPNHQSWLAQLQTDDRSALRTIFDAQYEDVCRVIFRFVHDPGLSEDLAQEVFVRLWEKRRDIHIDSNLPAYLRRMAANEALAHLRKKTRYLADELPTHLPGHTTAAADEQYEATELSGLITRAIDGLPPRCRTIFQLSRFEELTYQEIADQLELSIKTVENQMGKALKILREKLGGYINMLL